MMNRTTMSTPNTKDTVWSSLYAEELIDRAYDNVSAAHGERIDAICGTWSAAWDRELEEYGFTTLEAKRAELIDAAEEGIKFANEELQRRKSYLARAKQWDDFYAECEAIEASF